MLMPAWSPFPRRSSFLADPQTPSCSSGSYPNRLKACTPAALLVPSPFPCFASAFRSSTVWLLPPMQLAINPKGPGFQDIGDDAVVLDPSHYTILPGGVHLQAAQARISVDGIPTVFDDSAPLPPGSVEVRYDCGCASGTYQNLTGTCSPPDVLVPSPPTCPNSQDAISTVWLLPHQDAVLTRTIDQIPVTVSIAVPIEIKPDAYFLENGRVYLSPDYSLTFYGIAWYPALPLPAGSTQIIYTCPPALLATQGCLPSEVLLGEHCYLAPVNGACPPHLILAGPACIDCPLDQSGFKNSCYPLPDQNGACPTDALLLGGTCVPKSKIAPSDLPPCQSGFVRNLTLDCVPKTFATLCGPGQHRLTLLDICVDDDPVCGPDYHLVPSKILGLPGTCHIAVDPDGNCPAGYRPSGDICVPVPKCDPRRQRLSDDKTLCIDIPRTPEPPTCNPKTQHLSADKKRCLDNPPREAEPPKCDPATQHLNAAKTACVDNEPEAKPASNTWLVVLGLAGLAAGAGYLYKTQVMDKQKPAPKRRR